MSSFEESLFAQITFDARNTIFIFGSRSRVCGTSMSPSFPEELRPSGVTTPNTSFVWRNHNITHVPIPTSGLDYLLVWQPLEFLNLGLVNTILFPARVSLCFGTTVTQAEHLWYHLTIINGFVHPRITLPQCSNTSFYSLRVTGSSPQFYRPFLGLFQNIDMLRREADRVGDLLILWSAVLLIQHWNHFLSFNAHLSPQEDQQPL